jgi:flagellar basal-body rod protein FlgF
MTLGMRRATPLTASAAEGPDRHVFLSNGSGTPMENPSYIALSHMNALRRQLDVVANNIANAATHGYRAERLVFHELVTPKAAVTAIKGSAGHASFGVELGTFRDLRSGGLERTGSQLDVAINGPGYFAIDAGGTARFTRHGSFRPDTQNRLTTADGHLVLGSNGTPVTLPQGETEFEIDRRGNITGRNGPIGQLRVVRFANEQELRKVGENQYETQQEPTAIGNDTQIAQGMIETSNVNSVVEITQMIELSRRYQSASRLLEQEHDRARRAIDRLARLN